MDQNFEINNRKTSENSNSNVKNDIIKTNSTPKNDMTPERVGSDCEEKVIKIRGRPQKNTSMELQRGNKNEAVIETNDEIFGDALEKQTNDDEIEITSSLVTLIDIQAKK